MLTCTVAANQRKPKVFDGLKYFKAELALTSEGFTDIDFATLMLILARETLNCKETVVFAAAQAWGK